MKDQNSVPVVFVNSVVGRGILNGVANLTFCTFNFTPTEEKVDTDPVISARLRMDKVCLYQLQDVLSNLISSIEEAEKTTEAPPELEDSKQTKRVKPH